MILEGPYSSDVTSSDSFSHQTQLRHPYSCTHAEWYFTAQVLPAMLV